MNVSKEQNLNMMLKINVMMSLLAMVMEKVFTLLLVPTRKESGCLMLLMRQKVHLIVTNLGHKNVPVNAKGDTREPNCLTAAKPNTNGGFRRCRSVGDPHPNTASGANFNLYDAGEFVWSRHPDVPIEARLRTRPAGRVAVNRGFSLKKCKGDEWPNGQINFSGNRQGCETISMDSTSTSKLARDEIGAKCKCQKIGRSFAWDANIQNEITSNNER